MILVTTPNGKVGHHVAQQLIERNVPVRIGAHTVAKAQAAFPGADVVHFDLDDEASIRAALDGVDKLYLASPGHMPSDPVKRVVDLAKQAGARHIVSLSALGAEYSDNPLSQVERHIQASGLDWTFLRPNWFMQNFSTTSAQTIREQGVFYEPSGDAKTAFVDARDIAAIAVAALTEDGHAGQAYPITGSRAIDRNAVAAAISAALGKEVRYVPTSDEQFRQTMAGVGAPPHYIDFMSSIYGAVRAGQTETVTDTVERVTGRPPITIEQFARAERDAWL